MAQLCPASWRYSGGGGRTHVLEGYPTTADSAGRTGSLSLLTADLYCLDHLYYPQTVPVFGSAQSITEPEKP